jgi:hypothetical protein
MTSAAVREVRTLRIDPPRRAADYSSELRASEAGPLLRDFDFDLLTLQDEWNKNGLIRAARQAIATINEFFDGKEHRAKKSDYPIAMISAESLRFSIRRRASVIGRLNRRGPALPGLR